MTTTPRRWWCTCGLAGSRSSAAGGASGLRRAMTTVRGGGAGGAWTSGRVQVFLEADAPRVVCAEHGVAMAVVPWARHGAGLTRDFEDQTAWLAMQASASAIRALMRIAGSRLGGSSPGWSPSAAKTSTRPWGSDAPASTRSRIARASAT